MYNMHNGVSRILFRRGGGGGGVNLIFFAKMVWGHAPRENLKK